MAAQVTVLVTGGHGLLGRALSKVVASGMRAACDNESWIFVARKDGDLRNCADVFAMFDLHQPTHVMHLAAKLGGVHRKLV
jgi:GDP-L-fucose synthase